MKKVWLVLVLSMGIIWGCSDSRKQQEIAQRNQAVEQWFKAADAVVEKSGSSEAAQIVEFVKKSAYLVIPKDYDSEDSFAIEVAQEMPRTGYRIAITALMSQDAKLGKRWKKIWDGKNHAFLFIPEDSKSASLLFLKEEGMSDPWKGVVLIHEASHAILHYSGIMDAAFDDEDLRNAAYELETYTLQSGIIEAIGGIKYVSLREREMQRLEKELKTKKIMTPHYDQYTQELDEIFGKAKSRKEIELRAESLWFDAMLKLYDRMYEAEEAAERKLNFLGAIGEDRFI